MDFRHVLPPRARRTLDHVTTAVSGPPVDPGLRVTLTFHPDHVSAGLPILAALARDGAYHSRFVTGTGTGTGTGNGGLTAHPGGDRTRWESRIFGGVYDDAEPPERPVCGAPDFRRQVVGTAPPGSAPRTSG